MKPAQPNSGRLQGLAGVPHAQGVSAPTSHFHGCPLQPWLLILSPALQARGQPSAPPQQLPIFAWPRPHLTTPSWHQMLPINFVRTQAHKCQLQSPDPKYFTDETTTGSLPMTQAWIPAPAPHFSGNWRKTSQELSGDLRGESPPPRKDRQLCSPQHKQCEWEQHSQPHRVFEEWQRSAPPYAGREGGDGGSGMQSHSAQPWCPPASFLISLQVLQSARLLRVFKWPQMSLWIEGTSQLDKTPLY